MNCVVKIASALGLVVFFAGHAPGEVILVRDGTSEYEIVQGVKPGPVVKLAAAELQHFIRRATGVELPIVKDADPLRGHVFLGPNPVSAGVDVTPAGLPAEGYRLRTVGRDIHIVGADTHGTPEIISSNYPVQCGTMNGVYELLERYVGVVFAWHDELGTVVPQQTEIIVPEVDVTDGPDWHYRKLAYGPEGQEYKLFGRRLRLGSTYSTSYGHAWYRILPIEKYGEEHPEYFALVNGKRQTSYHLSHHGGQVCTSNQEVVEIFAEAAIDFFSKNPGRGMFSISPNARSSFCNLLVHSMLRHLPVVVNGRGLGALRSRASMPLDPSVHAVPTRRPPRSDAAGDAYPPRNYDTVRPA